MIALVTGAGSGIGQRTALALAEAGMFVVLAGRRKEKLQETAEMGGSESQFLVAPADVTCEQSVEQLFDAAVKRFGRLDLLFNNAGINVPATPIEDLSLADWQSVVDTNLTGMFLCTRAAVRIMKAQDPQGGRIINNGSVSAQVPRPDSAAYTATKHAVTGLTKSTALDGRRYNIACGQIDIGNADTEMATRMKQGIPQADGSIREEPTMDIKNVADAIVYMATRRLDANVPFMTVMATKMPLVGRG